MNQRLTCVVCDKSFSKLWNARSHVRIHFDAKAFKCKRCDYSSVQKGNLLMHMKKGVCKREGKRKVKKEEKVIKALLDISPKNE